MASFWQLRYAVTEIYFLSHCVKFLTLLMINVLFKELFKSVVEHTSFFYFFARNFKTPNFGRKDKACLASTSNRQIKVENLHQELRVQILVQMVLLVVKSNIKWIQGIKSYKK